MALADVCGLNEKSFNNSLFGVNRSTYSDALFKDVEVGSNHFSMPYNYDVSVCFLVIFFVKKVHITLLQAKLGGWGDRQVNSLL